MALSNCFLSILKILTVIILLLGITIPIYYQSTNVGYLGLRVIHSLLTVICTFIPDSNRPMLSAEYRAFETILRYSPLPEYDPMANPLEIAKKMRESFQFDVIVPRPAQCQVKKQLYEYEEQTVETYWIDHRDGNINWNTDRILIYLHGGGYFLGDFQTYSGFECHLSHLFNITVIHLEYRRVPEYPLPAAVDDGLILYRSLLRDSIPSSRLIVMGDSAGGGLALLTVQAILAHQLPKPCAVITLSPFTDLSLSGESFTRNRLTDVVARIELMSWQVEQILGPNHSQISRNASFHSPLFGSFKDFPPLYVTAGTAEVLEDDARRIVDKAQLEGVDVTFDLGEHLMHVHPLFFPFFREARDTLNNIQQWIKTKL